eukprot:TRINITY_DN6311_c0_g2_i1.p1 TRINITY_DN6311_c0_g2~~TRINITY_DN6311_c0_g2_i1.p1  ORF type:complete len:674 (-),score=119.94 TRINITY_DN6311_c0_g2_i1:717-2738(-)
MDAHVAVGSMGATGGKLIVEGKTRFVLDVEAELANGIRRPHESNGTHLPKESVAKSTAKLTGSPKEKSDANAMALAIASSRGTVAKVEEAQAGVGHDSATPRKGSAKLSRRKRAKGETDEANGSVEAKGASGQLVGKKRGQYSNWHKDNLWKPIQETVEKEQNLIAALRSLQAGHKTAAHPDGVYAKLSLTTLRSWFHQDGTMRDTFKEKLGREKMDMRGKVGILTRFPKLEGELRTELKILKQRGHALTVPLVQQCVQRYLQTVYPEILKSGFLVSPTWCARFLRGRIKYTLSERMASGWKFRGKFAQKAKNLGPLPLSLYLPKKGKPDGIEEEDEEDEEVDVDGLEDKEEANKGLEWMTTKANGAKPVRKRKGVDDLAETKALATLAANESDDDLSTSFKDAARQWVKGGPANAFKKAMREESKLREMRRKVEKQPASVRRKQRSSRKDGGTGSHGEGAAGQGEISSAILPAVGNGARLGGGDGEAQEACTAVGRSVAARKSGAANGSGGAGRSSVTGRRSAMSGNGTRMQENDSNGANPLTLEKRIRRRKTFADGSVAAEYGSSLHGKAARHVRQKNTASATHDGQDNLSTDIHDGQELAIFAAEESVTVVAHAGQDLALTAAEESVSVDALSEAEERSPEPPKRPRAIMLPGAFSGVIPSPSKTYVRRK